MGSENGPIAGASNLQMFVLDVLQYDVAEQVDSILRLLNNEGCIGWREFWEHDFTEVEVVEALRALVHGELVTVFQVDTLSGELSPTNWRELPDDVGSFWFGQSDNGKLAWDAWEPPVAGGR